MKIHRIVASILIFVSSVSNAKNDAGEFENKAIIKAEGVLVKEGYKMSKYSKPRVYAKGDPKSPLESWAKKLFPEKKLKELSRIDFLVVEFKLKEPAPGGVTLLIFSRSDKLELVARAGAK